MDILKYLSPTPTRGGGGILSRIAYNAQMEDEISRAEAKKQEHAMAISNAMRRMGEAPNQSARIEAMADYAAQGYDINDLRHVPDTFSGKQPQRKYATAPDGIQRYIDTGEPVFPGINKPEKPEPRKYLQGADGRYRYLDTGMPVFDDDAKPEKPKEPRFKLGGKDIDTLSNEIYANLPDFGDTDHLDPALERDILNKASSYYAQSGNPTEAVSKAFEELGISGGMDALEKVRSEGEWNPFVENKSYYAPRGTHSRRSAPERNDNDQMIAISNGKETFRIPANKLGEAMQEGFERIY